MKPDNVQRIIVEDFRKEDQDVVIKISTILNHFMTQVVEILTDRVDFANLNQDVVSITVTVDGSGVPTRTTKISSSKINRAQGAVVIYAANKTTPANTPTGTPFMSFTPTADGQVYTLNKITNLTANEEYTILAILIGRDL